MIEIKDNNALHKMRVAGEIVAKTLLLLEEKVCPGISTSELDQIAENNIIELGGKPAFKGLNGFPATLCISVNNEVIHGVPGKYKLKTGDIVSIDCGAVYKGYFSDAARTFPVGEISQEAERLINVTRESFFQGVEMAQEGNKISDISHAIQKYVEKKGYSIVRDYVGHGIGKKLHEAPDIPNFGPSGRGPLLRCGMVLAIEPMVNEGSKVVKTLSDGWTVVTKDNSLSAHYENTVAILSQGPEILTLIK